jgi:hypothetical protein
LNLQGVRARFQPSRSRNVPGARVRVESVIMTPEERDLITKFVQRVGGPAAAGGGFGSVPSAAPQPPLPPVDRDADALIADLFARQPEARYRVTQMAFVQEHALMEAQNRINRLEWELNQAKTAAQPAQPAASPWGQAAQQQQQQSSGGFFGGLFGGRSAPPPQAAAQPMYAAPPQPVYAPGYQPGMFQQGGGSGFLGSALTTAAGVAGGMVAGNALMNLFSGGHGGGFGGGFAGPAGGTTVVENFYGGAPGSSQPSTWSDPYAQGGEPKSDTGWTDSGGGVAGWSNPTSGPGWTDQQADSGGWTDSTPDAGGWDDPDPT